MAIPYGKASWLPSGAIGAAGTTAGIKFAMIGGMVMGKKIALGVAVLVAVGLVWVGTRHSNGNDQARRESSAPTVSVAGAQEDIAPSPTIVPAVVSTEPEASPPASPEIAITDHRPASVSGQITTRDGTPIPDAEVILEIARDGDRSDIAKRYRTTAGPDGVYRIAGIDVFDDAVLYASADGYTMDFRTVDIREAMQKQDLDMLLARAAFYVAGYVRSQSRQPIPDASVDTMYYGYDEDGLAFTAATGRTTGNIGGIKLTFAITDSQGHFKLALPREGLCDLRVVKEGYGPGFFPRVPAGTDNADLVLRIGGAIEGRVTTMEGKPVAGERVTVRGDVLPGGLTPSDVRIQTLPAAPASAVTDERGFYTVDGLGEDYAYTVAIAGASASNIQDLPTAQGLRTIAEMMAEFNRDAVGEADVAAQKADVRVKSGQTTRSVDLVVGVTNYGTVFGTVTDRSSGKPVCPIAITAATVDAEGTGLRAVMKGSHGGTAVTDLDGRYVLRIANLQGRTQFRIGHVFMTEGGSAWEQPEDIAETVDLGPGDEREVNLTIDAPVTVPVRYVGTNGAPREGVLAAMRCAGCGGGCGGTLISDAEGRVKFHGIRSGVSLEAIAWVEIGSDLKTVGVSEPFTGEPGETMPEVTVICTSSGGIAGAMTFPDGNPVADAELIAGAIQPDGTVTRVEAQIVTDASGVFVLGEAFPEGIYAAVGLGLLAGDPALPYSVTIPNVEIAAGAITDLGALTVAVEKDLTRVLAAAGYDRKSNEAIASAYSADWLPSLTSPSDVLRSGMALYDVGRYDEALTVFRHMAEVASPEGIDVPIAMVWEGQMLDLLGRRQEAVNVYESVAAMNVDSEIRHDQFGMDYKPSDYARERMQQPFARVENLE